MSLTFNIKKYKKTNSFVFDLQNNNEQGIYSEKEKEISYLYLLIFLNLLTNKTLMVCQVLESKVIFSGD